MDTVLSTVQHGGADLPDFWQRAIADHFVHCTTTLPPDFRGAMSNAHMGSIRYNRVEATRHRAARTAADVETHQKDLVLLNVVVSGVARVLQDGREAVLRSGDFAIHDSTRPYSLVFDTAFSQIIFQFPRPLLKQRIGCFDRYTAVKVSSKDQIGKLASDFLLNIGRLDNRVDPIVAERLSAQTVDLVALALSTQMGAGMPSSRSSHRSALLYRAKTFVEAHLRDKLNPATVAQALGCSARYVNSLFADEQTTLGDYVLRRRLEQCRDDLASGPITRRVSEIAYAWGFNSPAHFCRSFKAQFGLTPGEFRARTALQEPALIGH